MAGRYAADGTPVAFDVSGLWRRLQALADGRRRQGKRYPRALVLLLVVLAKLPGEDRLLASTATGSVKGTLDAQDPEGVHLLVAYIPKEGIVLLQVAVGHKTNEITAAAALPGALDLRDKIAAGDALHRQRALLPPPPLRGHSGPRLRPAVPRAPSMRRASVQWQLIDMPVCLARATSPRQRYRDTAGVSSRPRSWDADRTVAQDGPQAAASGWRSSACK